MVSLEGGLGHMVLDFNLLNGFVLRSIREIVLRGCKKKIDVSCLNIRNTC